MPQRKDAKRKSADTTSNWIRIGVLSAMVTAPLIARWNEMQASYRAQTLRELAAARLSDARIARDQAMVRLAPIREVANARIEDARVLANARLDDAINRLAQVRTPDALQNVPPFSLARKRLLELEKQRQRQQRRTTILWLAGVGVGLVAAGAGAYFIARRRMTTTIEVDELMVEIPSERNLAEATVGKGSSTRNSYASTAERADGVPVQSYAGSGTTSASGGMPRYVGNIHTMVYHSADDTGQLPAEE
ncbi:MAG TPA: hypothetical protein VJR48_03870, partial [Ktedonobacterales bacterium]|nr:hypothetical protein [Ktedonobacterales bacterium]